MTLLEEIFVGLEDIAPNGKENVEKEYEIYGRMLDIGLLGSAVRSELQEQWGLPIARVKDNYASGSIRVRMIDNEKYILTSKVKTDTGNDEVEHEVGEALFTHFRKFATQGLRKVRHFFPVEGSEFVYEVDAFYNEVGQFSPWVKIDLELPNGDDIESLPDLPFELEDIKVIPPGRKSPANLDFVLDLFVKHFNLKNQYIDHAPVIPSVESAKEDKKEEKESGLVTKKKEFVDLGKEAGALALSLSYDADKEEADIKKNLHEVNAQLMNYYK